MKETSKIYRQMGEKVGIRAERISQRGIIARRFLQAYLELESELFTAQCRRIRLN